MNVTGRTPKLYINKDRKTVILSLKLNCEKTLKRLLNVNFFTDINECAGNNECHVYARCENADGLYICTCKSGYEGNGITCTGTTLESTIKEQMQ